VDEGFKKSTEEGAQQKKKRSKRRRGTEVAGDRAGDMFVGEGG